MPYNLSVRGANTFMTSQERHEARYQRRRAARRARQEARCAALGSLGEVFSYHTMFKYGRKCCNGVRWKQSTQNFERHLFSHTAKQRRLILAKRWRPKKYVHFTVCERGKIRGIDAPHITDRQIHKVISKEVLEPLYDPSMIYDNGASRICTGRSSASNSSWHGITASMAVRAGCCCST